MTRAGQGARIHRNQLAHEAIPALLGDDDRPASLPCARPPSFMRQGLCALPQNRRIDFFVENNVAAKQLCSKCPVRSECREWAIATKQPFGIWGGLDTAERRQLT